MKNAKDLKKKHFFFFQNIGGGWGGCVKLMMP